MNAKGRFIEEGILAALQSLGASISKPSPDLESSQSSFGEEKMSSKGSNARNSNDKPQENSRQLF